jgi:hypothetical protein
MTFAAGTYIRLVANTAVFQDSDVGQQIWVRYDEDGAGSGGRATITRVDLETEAVAYVTEDIDEVNLAEGGWEFATKDLNNLHLFEGLTVNVQADGGGHSDKIVAEGSLSLDYYASRIMVGFKYVGRLVTHNLDFGGRLGPSAAKPRNIKRIRARFLDTIACEVGSDQYNLEEIVWNQDGDLSVRVPPPFSGVKNVPLLDAWDESTKQPSVVHDEPTPCTVLSLDIEGHIVEPP